MIGDEFSRRVLAWFDLHGRHDLPWQLERGLYTTWVSEIMLQQTQVRTVVPYYERFIQQFPDQGRLANASIDEVLASWSGLGYYTRARNLHKTAQIVWHERGGRLPDNLDDWLSLPGIGLSTAGAILAQALGKRHPILDGNVRRVLSRHHAIEGWPGLASVNKLLWQLAESHTPDERLADYSQAMMDLGATVCTTRSPRCEECPISQDCRAYRSDRVEQFPTKKPKKGLPVKTVNMLMIRNQQGALLLERRPPTGIWGGLWSLPETTSEDVIELCNDRWALRCNHIGTEESFRHTFSHYHLDITPHRLEVESEGSVINDEAWRWIRYEDLHQVGVASPVSSLLRSHFERLDSKQVSRLNTHP